MPNPNKLIQDIEDKNRSLSQANTEYLRLTQERAECERQYSIALAQKMLALKLEGTQITIIDKLAKGDKLVADLKYKLDVAEGVVKARKQSMDNLITNIDSYRSMLTWLREEKHRA